MVEKTNRPFKGDRFRRELYQYIRSNLLFIHISCTCTLDGLSFLLWFLVVVMQLNYLLNGCGYDTPAWSNIYIQLTEVHGTCWSRYFHVSHMLKWISTGYILVWVNESLHLWELRCSLFQVPFDGCSARYQQTIPPRRGSMHRRLQGWSSKVCKIHSSISQTLLCVFEGLIKNYQGHNSSIQT